MDYVKDGIKLYKLEFIKPLSYNDNQFKVIDSSIKNKIGQLIRVIGYNRLRKHKPEIKCGEWYTKNHNPKYKVGNIINVFSKDNVFLGQLIIISINNNGRLYYYNTKNYTEFKILQKKYKNLKIIESDILNRNGSLTYIDKLINIKKQATIKEVPVKEYIKKVKQITTDDYKKDIIKSVASTLATNAIIFIGTIIIMKGLGGKKLW